MLCFKGFIIFGLIFKYGFSLSIKILNFCVFKRLLILVVVIFLLSLFNILLVVKINLVFIYILINIYSILFKNVYFWVKKVIKKVFGVYLIWWFW